MIVLSGNIAIDPAVTDTALDATHALETATRCEEGCISYGIWSSPNAPGTLFFFEEWEDEDALNSHMGSDHMATFLGACAGFGITGTDIWRYEVTAKTKFM